MESFSPWVTSTGSPCYQNQQQPSSTKGGGCYSVSLHCGASWSGWSDVLMLPRTHQSAQGDIPANLCGHLLTRWVGHRWCSLDLPRLSLSFFTEKKKTLLESRRNSTPCRRDSVENVTVWKRAAGRSSAQPTSCRSLRRSGVVTSGCTCRRRRRHQLGMLPTFRLTHHTEKYSL